MIRQTLRTAMLAALVSAPLAAQKAHLISGSIKDPTTRTGIPGALVEVKNAAGGLSSRSDEIGEFRLYAPAGTYQLTVRRIGYAPMNKQVTLPDDDTEIDLELNPLPQKLATVHVGGSGSGIYGIVESGSLDRPMPYARVQVAGARLDTLTDSLGAFFFEVKPGRYVIRIGRAGYASEMFSIDVGKNQVVDASTILDKSEDTPPPGFEGLWADFDQRLRWRGMNSALLSGPELRHANSQLDYAIQTSPALVSKGLKLGRSVCVFENGIPRPGFGLEQYRVENIETVEVYSAGDDAAQYLAKMWPPRAACSPPTNRSLPGGNSGSIRWVSIWQKRP